MISDTQGVYPLCVSVYTRGRFMCTQVVSGLACRGQRTSDPPELELQACEMPDMGVCGEGGELSSARAIRSLHC